MAAAAAMMKQVGFRVTGSDTQVYPPMSTYLKKESIPFATHYDASNVAPPPDLVVIGNAISRGNPELEEILDLKIPYISLPELLKKELIQGRRSLVVAGTHGKTTCTSLFAWTLESCGRDPSYFVGGIPLNFGRGIKWGRGEEVVMEGDEYDSAFFDKRPKFLHYMPDLMIVTSIEFDHADIYGSLTDIETAFAGAQRLIPRNGLVVANRDEPAVRRALRQTFCRVEWFGFGKEATWQVTDTQVEEEGISFSPRHNGRRIDRLHLPLMGEHNALNALAVYISCHWLGLSHKDIATGFGSFLGVRRRLEKKGTFGGVNVFDDFAHHPTSIEKTLAAIEHHNPGRRIWAVFEPRSNTTRRNFFQRELVKAFRGASEVVIGAVYKEDAIDPAQRLDPVQLAQTIERRFPAKARHIGDVDAIVAFLLSHVREGDIVVVMSNGAFGGLTDKLVKRMGEGAPSRRRRNGSNPESSRGSPTRNSG